MFRLKYLPHREPGEKIVFFLHRHWFILVKVVVSYVFLAILPIIAYFFIQKELSYILDSDITIIFLNLLIFTFYLYWWLLFYHAFLDYFLDIWIVTNRRVINIEQKSLFHRVVAEHKLFRIQDVMSEQKGMLPTFLDYGQIHIQTAATEKMVLFEQVKNPHKIAQEIIKLIEHHKHIMAKTMDKIDKMEGSS